MGCQGPKKGGIVALKGGSNPGGQGGQRVGGKGGPGTQKMGLEKEVF